MLLPKVVVPLPQRVLLNAAEATPQYFRKYSTEEPGASALADASAEAPLYPRPMDVVVAGGHGKIGLRLLRLLAARRDRARGLVRNPDHVADLEAVGAEGAVCDLERDEADVAGAVAGADAVVFAAGAGPGSGAERKQTMDLGGAVRLIEAARSSRVERYLMISAMGAHDPTAMPEEMRPYYDAKAEADEAVRSSGLAYTIVRPGRLTDDAGTGLVEVAERLEHAGEISRDDVAATLVAALDLTIAERTFDLLRGETPIAEALTAL